MTRLTGSMRSNLISTKCQGITVSEYENMREIVCIGCYYAGKGTTEETHELKLFKRNVDDSLHCKRESL